jgi:hypothetical protein
MAGTSPAATLKKWLNMTQPHSSFNSPRSAIIVEETPLAGKNAMTVSYKPSRWKTEYIDVQIR